MTKNDIRDWLGGFGCAGIILIFLLVLLLIFPLLLAIGGLVWGGIIWCVWNLVVVPVAGVPALTFFWQCFILGAALTLVLAALKGIVKVKGD